MFLPVNRNEMLERGITQPDFVYGTDHCCDDYGLHCGYRRFNFLHWLNRAEPDRNV